MKIGEARRFALSLPGATESPHFEKSSFRVMGRIFATVPPGEQHPHVFVNEPERDRMASMAPEAYERLWWGKKVVGLRVALARAKPRDVKELLHSAWERVVPKGVQTSSSRKRRDSQ